MRKEATPDFDRAEVAHGNIAIMEPGSLGDKRLEFLIIYLSHESVHGGVTDGARPIHTRRLIPFFRASHGCLNRISGYALWRHVFFIVL